MGFLRKWLGGIYEPEEFADILERLENAQREREQEEMTFDFGDVQRFIRTLDAVTDFYQKWIAELPDTNPHWYGHKLPKYISMVKERIQSNRPVDWTRWFGYIISDIRDGTLK